jgi:hypothetical protein
MNLFNRTVVTLLLLALIPIVTVALIVPQEAIQVLRDGLDQLESRLDLSVSTGRLVVSVVLAALIDGLLVFLLYLQVRRPRARAVPVHQAKGGQAQVAVDSIVERLAYHIDRLPGVLDAKPKIVAHRRGIEVVLDVEVVGDSNVPAVIEEVSALTRQVVEDEMGLRLKGKPKLNLRTVAYPQPAALGRAAAAPVRRDRDLNFQPPTSNTQLVGDETGAGAGDVREPQSNDEPASADAAG